MGVSEIRDRVLVPSQGLVQICRDKVCATGGAPLGGAQPRGAPSGGSAAPVRVRWGLGWEGWDLVTIKGRLG